MNDPTIDEKAVPDTGRTKSGRRSPGYWEDFEHVREGLESLIGKLGHFPTGREIRKSGGRILEYAFTRYHGGLEKVRKRMGYDPRPEKPRGYWKDIVNVQKELEPLVEELGHFPSQNEIIAADMGSLVNSVTEYHGGLTAVREQMGYDPRPEKPRGYWKDFVNVRKELEPLVEELGHFPSQTEIAKFDRDILAAAAARHHGGLTKVREQMGYDPRSENPHGYWQDLEHVRERLEPLVKQLGRFPYPQEVKKYGEMLYVSINRHHGGLTAVKVKLGYADRELEVIRQAMHELQ